MFCLWLKWTLWNFCNFKFLFFLFFLKSLKFFHVLASNSLNQFKPVNKVNFSPLKDSISFENQWSILFFVLLMIFIILAKQEVWWSPLSYEQWRGLQIFHCFCQFCLCRSYNHYFHFTRANIILYPLSSSYQDFIILSCALSFKLYKFIKCSYFF